MSKIQGLGSSSRGGHLLRGALQALPGGPGKGLGVIREGRQTPALRRHFALFLLLFPLFCLVFGSWCITFLPYYPLGQCFQPQYYCYFGLGNSAGGAVAYIRGCFTASLAFTHHVPEAATPPPCNRVNQKLSPDIATCSLGGKITSPIPTPI